MWLPCMVGEVFLLEDGGEVDLDLGNYERFLDARLTKDNNITTGKIYQQVIEREVHRRTERHPSMYFSAREITWARRCRWCPM